MQTTQAYTYLQMHNLVYAWATIIAHSFIEIGRAKLIFLLAYQIML